MRLLSLDIGTTHCKAGLFAGDGSLLRLTSRPMALRHNVDGYASYDPRQLWEMVLSILKEVVTSDPGPIAALGIASMAETGLLVDRRSGAPRSLLIPWFDTAAREQAALIGRQADRFERFCATGLRPSFKYGLAKLLWLREREPAALNGSVWLSVADYVAYCLTGQLATDYTLAARTYAFRIYDKTWDQAWIRQWGFEPELFPEAGPGTRAVGRVTAGELKPLGLAGAPVAIAGHDHLCAALAVGAIHPGVVLDSMGTAESLIGALEERPLGRADFESGLSYGCHVAPGRMAWIGGLSASGGSIEWLRELLAEPPLSYEQIEALLSTTRGGPSGILYFPYLSGSGAPLPDPKTRAAFIGLMSSHGRADLLKAVLEGTAYEMESIRRVAELATGTPIKMLIAAGGGTLNTAWLQIKADVSGCDFTVLAFAEATLLGAALVAGVAGGLYTNVKEAVYALGQREATQILPHAARHQAYQWWYEKGYLKLQQPLREHYNTI